MKNLFPLILVLMGMTMAFAQNSVTLTFECQNTDGSYLQPDSITIENITRNWQETIYYPDTTFTLMVGTGIQNHLSENSLQVMPNPFNGTAKVNIQSMESETVEIKITDMGGRVFAEYNGLLQEGGNIFTISLTTPQMFLLSVKTSSGVRSLKIENTGRSGANRISYNGVAGENTADIRLKSTSSHPYELGDEMRYRGFSSSRISAEIRKNQYEDELITLVLYEVGSPCPETPTVTDIEGNIYNTVQIGGQCWMKENLRTTKFPDGTDIPLSSGTYTIEYNNPCYSDLPIVSDIPLIERGYLYNWVAANMACPTGWHLPTDEEWNTMEATQTTMDVAIVGDRGDHAGRLAGGSSWVSSSEVNAPGNMEYVDRNASGFFAIPAGAYEVLYNQYFYECAAFWTSTEVSAGNAWERTLLSYSAFVFRSYGGDEYPNKGLRMSVRCLRD